MDTLGDVCDPPAAAELLTQSVQKNKDLWSAFVKGAITVSQYRESIISKLGSYSRESGEPLSSPDEYGRMFDESKWISRVKLTETEAMLLCGAFKAQQDQSHFTALTANQHHILTCNSKDG